MYSKNDHIYIRTNYRGFVGPLMQSGPIVNPLMCKISDVIQLIMSGMEIQQYDPKTKQSIILNMDNVWDDAKFSPKTKEETLGIANSVTPKVITGTPKIETSVVEEPKTEETPVEVKEEVKDVVVDPVVDVPPTADKETVVVENTTNSTEVTSNSQTHLTKSQRKALRREQQKQNNATNSESPVTTQESENKE